MCKGCASVVVVVVVVAAVVRAKRLLLPLCDVTKHEKHGVEG